MCAHRPHHGRGSPLAACYQTILHDRTSHPHHLLPSSPTHATPHQVASAFADVSSVDLKPLIERADLTVRLFQDDDLNQRYLKSVRRV